MKKGMIISLILIMIIGMAVMLGKSVYAIEPLQNLPDLTSTGSGTSSSNSTTSNTATPSTTTTPTNTANNTTNTANTSNKATNNTTNSSSASKSKIPQTGSNSWIVYIAGVVVLAIVSGVVLKKFVGIKLQ